MKKTDDVFSLIKSLSRSEKRYFKLAIARNSIGESSHYLKLFDVIEKAGTAERKTIQKLYGDDNFMKKQFKSYKNRLYDQILNSLSAYHSEGSVDDQILELIRKAKILYDKTLYTHATDVLEKAKKIACKYEKQTLLLEIVRWQKEIINNPSLYGKISEKDITRLFEEEKLTVHKIENANEYWKPWSLMYLTYHDNGIVRLQEDIDKYDAIINVPIFKNQELILSYQAQRDFYSIHYIYSLAVNKDRDAYEYSKKSIALMEAHPNQIEVDPVRYIKVFHNMLLMAQLLKKYAEFFNILPKFKSMLNRFHEVMNENIRSTVLLSSYNLEFSTYVGIGQFQKAALLLPEIETILNEQKNKNTLIALVFNINIVVLYCGNGNYNKALMKLNIILDNEKNILEHNIYSFLKAFQLIIHFEKGNRDFLPYLVKSVYRSLLQSKKLYKTESILIRFFRTSLNKINNKQDQMEAFKSLKEELTIAIEDSLEASFLENFDVISWLESKIENRPFGEILREKSGYILEEL